MSARGPEGPGGVLSVTQLEVTEMGTELLRHQVGPLRRVLRALPSPSLSPPQDEGSPPDSLSFRFPRVRRSGSDGRASGGTVQEVFKNDKMPSKQEAAGSPQLLAGRRGAT